MKAFFDQVSNRVSKVITNEYSTSFSKGTNLLEAGIRTKIYAIYGFVRLADEIVDSFHGYPQQELFDKFKEDYYHAVKYKISTNPVLNSFQKVTIDYNLHELADRFLESMEMDLTVNNYTTEEAYQNYIHGSAEVVGLMCLRIFVENNEDEYQKLKPYAIKLGSAFQKVNFLRDIKDDMFRLGRVYFPNVNWNNLTEKNKQQIIQEVKDEFNEAFTGIKMLPKNAQFGVYLAYSYYLSLLNKISRKKSSEIIEKRTRIPDFMKVLILYKANIKYKLGII